MRRHRRPPAAWKRSCETGTNVDCEGTRKAAAAWAAKRFKEFGLKSEDLHQAEPRKRIAATHQSPEQAETKTQALR
jgi:hypothetical protein